MPSSSPAPRSATALAHAVLMPGFAGWAAPQWVLDAVRGGLGGVCYFGHNIESVEQVAALSAQLHTAGPVLISVDEEGGIVTRLHVSDGSPHVGAAALGRGDVAITRLVAGLIGAEVHAAGIDIDLAPVADVNSNPANPVIGVRSFGADSRQVSAHTRAFVAGVQSQGVAACAKHFPGHGDTQVDSHVGLPTVDADLATLRARELVPFAAAIDQGVKCVMTAHAVFTAIDDLPATISPVVLGVLRHELAFGGVIISDAIDMGAISGTIGFGEGVVRALIAGVDLVGLGNPVLGGTTHESDEGEFAVALAAIVGAVDDGRLTLARLAESAERIRLLREWLGAQGEVAALGPITPDPDGVAADVALRVRGDVGVQAPAHIVDVRRRRNVASGRLTSLLARELVERMPGSRATAVFAQGAGAEGRVTDDEQLPNPGTESRERRHPSRPDVIVTGTPGQDAGEGEVLETLLREHPEAVVVCLGWSGDADDIPSARNVVFAFGDSRPTARAVADRLCS